MYAWKLICPETGLYIVKAIWASGGPTTPARLSTGIIPWTVLMETGIFNYR